MATTLAGNATNARPAALQDVNAETQELRLSRALTHNSDHAKVFVQTCMFCAARAVNAIEKHNERQETAQTFLATLPDQGFVLDSIRYVRTALGNDAPAWMFKPEYLR